ncbi:MAG TPA: XrtA/PEP-CTERM system-associated ATPase [Burkholderiaceae bacterium]|nr:XrtA/PEP-CTERM system-associated ATPase [Burkholderiaceae bacterium]
MYEAFYGLHDKPFQANPNPLFYFASRQHQRAMSYLDYGLHCNEGFIVITGEVGAGKTMVARNLLNRLNHDKIISAHLVSTQLGAEDALQMVCSAFGVTSSDTSKAAQLNALQKFLSDAHHAGKRCLLVVDEAQNLSMQAVEELRMLSNFQINSRALLQSFLIGQPEFRQTLQSPQMTQLRQRVIAACHIGPLDVAETEAYIMHRLRCAGWKESPRFAPEVFREIHRASTGIPRRINAICDRLLLSGFLSGKCSFSGSDAIETASEIDGETSLPASAPAMAGGDATPNGSGQASCSASSHDVLEALTCEDFSLRLSQLENRMARIEAALDGLLRNNSSALALLGRITKELEHITAGAPAE